MFIDKFSLSTKTSLFNTNTKTMAVLLKKYTKRVTLIISVTCNRIPSCVGDRFH